MPLHIDHHEEDDSGDAANSAEHGASFPVKQLKLSIPASYGATTQIGGFGIRSGSRQHSDLGPIPDSARGPNQFDAKNHGEFASRQLKAEVADTYAICSALLTGFCVCTIFINHSSIEHERKEDPLRYYVLIVHQVIVRLCTALALFSTLIFMLSTMYMKTALARPSYAFRTFDRFSEETSTARRMGFFCMYYACIMYMLSISLVLFYTVPRSLAVVIATVVLVFLVVMWWYAEQMVQAAGPIFMPENKLHDLFDEAPMRPCDTVVDAMSTKKPTETCDLRNWRV